MLKKGTSILLLLIFALSQCKENKSIDFYSTSNEIVKPNEYNRIFKLASDSFYTWKSAGIEFYKEDSKKSNTAMDSLLCFSSKGDRFVSALLSRALIPDASMDAISFFYGEKINENWYFFHGGVTMIPRSMVKGHDVTKPLSYEQLHEIALKEVYSGYLKSNGEINEEWFTSQFENVGWCADCKTKEDYQRSRLKGVAGKWLNRDTTKVTHHP
jgi:hypothetical protein